MGVVIDAVRITPAGDRESARTSVRNDARTPRTPGVVPDAGSYISASARDRQSARARVRNRSRTSGFVGVVLDAGRFSTAPAHDRQSAFAFVGDGSRSAVIGVVPNAVRRGYGPARNRHVSSGQRPRIVDFFYDIIRLRPIADVTHAVLHRATHRRAGRREGLRSLCVPGPQNKNARQGQTDRGRDAELIVRII